MGSSPSKSDDDETHTAPTPAAHGRDDDNDDRQSQHSVGSGGGDEEDKQSVHSFLSGSDGDGEREGAEKNSICGSDGHHDGSDHGSECGTVCGDGGGGHSDDDSDSDSEFCDSYGFSSHNNNNNSPIIHSDIDSDSDGSDIIIGDHIHHQIDMDCHSEIDDTTTKPTKIHKLHSLDFDPERDGQVKFDFNFGEFAGSATDQGQHGVCYAHAVSDLITITTCLYENPRRRSSSSSSSRKWRFARHEIRQFLIHISEGEKIENQKFRKLNGGLVHEVLSDFIKKTRLPFNVETTEYFPYCELPAVFSWRTCREWNNKFSMIRSRNSKTITMPFRAAKSLIDLVAKEKHFKAKSGHAVVCLGLFAVNNSETDGEDVPYVRFKNSWHCWDEGIYEMPLQAFYRPKFTQMIPTIDLSIRDSRMRHECYNECTEDDPRRWTWQPITKRSRRNS
eukprot:c9946_g1_i1.p1 GENE.c9946_g1_i1~~c9946_g1_i1.p1  ORF type:complete len:461 (-),score=100.18 c9946_g1_i1:124-1464(-)